ncbi:MAG TPA: carboxypeptidase regulatory-like domain-containing protein [Terracidiphilus sp.]|nr:carboxypeptidase regulatory-like domain-containing protein [Terracidiphilus sp.]
MTTRSAKVARFARPLFSFALLLCCAAAVLAQAGRGSINGLVSDPTGAIVPGATVTAQDAGTGVKITTVSSAAGLYSFVSLTPGTYDVTASAKGFDTAVLKNVTVSVDQTTSVNITLKVGSVSEVVTVNETSALVDENNSTVGQLISSAAIDRVPLLTRNVYELVQLSAGVIPANGSPNSSSTPGIFNARSGIDVSSYTINGALQGTVYYMIDGSPVGVAENNAATMLPAFQMPEDGVDEYRVETQNTPATYASGGAGVISLVSKSGTNTFHGGGFVYIRPNVLAANEWFNKQNQISQGLPNETPDFHRYQEGGSISGPILHNKLFFFADYEATQQASLETGGFTVPTDAERTGDFSADSFTVYNPLVADDPTTGMRQPFDGNMIPQGDLNPIALKFATFFPEPNNDGEGEYHVNNYTASGLDPNDAQKFDIRGDYMLGQKHRLFSRFSFARLKFGNADLYGSSNEYDPLYYQNITNARNILLADDYSITPTSVLQLRYSFTRHYEDQTGDPRQGAFDITSVGFPQSLADQVLYKQIPTMSFSTTTTVGGTGNWDTFLFASESSDASATYTNVKGKHELSLGFEYQKLFMNIGQPPSPAGAYSFDDTATSSVTYAGDGSDFASFLIGMGTEPGSESYNFTKDVFAAEANPYWAFFVQDKYHITHNFTVDLGLRWDFFGGRTERHDRLEYFDPNLQFTESSIPLIGGERFAGTSGNGRSPFALNLKNLAPRIGFAWQPVQNLVVRGGAGFYYGPSPEMVANPSLNSDGFGTITNWNATEYNGDSTAADNGNPNAIPEGNSVFNSSNTCANNGDVQGCYSLSNPFPDGVVQPTGSSLGAATNLGSTLSTVLHTQNTPTTYNYNFGLEYQFPYQTVFSVAYVGSRGLFLPLGAVDLNALSIETIAQYGDSLLTDMVPNQWEAIQPATNANYGSDTVPLWVSLQPFPQFGNGGYGAGNGVNVNGFGGGDSEYSSLQAKVEKKLTHHFTMLGAFTWGKLITDDSAPPLAFVGYHGASPQDWRDLRLEHSLSSQDIKYQFNVSASYDLPVGRGRAVNLNGLSNAVLGNWTVNAIAYLSTGVPINSPTGTGDPYFNQRVDMTCDPGKGAPHTADQWFNYSCFADPASNFVPGSAPALLGSVRTDGAHDLDMSFYKSFPIGKEHSLRFEASVYNLTNTVQYGYPNVFWNPDPTPDNMAGFGQVFSSSNTPRQFQFGSRFTF